MSGFFPCKHTSLLTGLSSTELLFPCLKCFQNHFWMLTYLFIFKVHFIFQSTVKFTAKLSRGQNSHISATHSAFASVYIPHHSGLFVTTDKPTRIHHYPPKSLVLTRVHSWYYLFYGF